MLRQRPVAGHVVCCSAWHAHLLCWHSAHLRVEQRPILRVEPPLASQHRQASHGQPRLQACRHEAQQRGSEAGEQASETTPRGHARPELWRRARLHGLHNAGRSLDAGTSSIRGHMTGAHGRLRCMHTLLQIPPAQRPNRRLHTPLVQPLAPAPRASFRPRAPGPAATARWPHLHKLHSLQRHLAKRVGVAAKQDVPEVVHLAGAGDDVSQLGVVDEPAGRGGGGGGLGPEAWAGCRCAALLATTKGGRSTCRQGRNHSHGAPHVGVQSRASSHCKTYSAGGHAPPASSQRRWGQCAHYQACDAPAPPTPPSSRRPGCLPAVDPGASPSQRPLQP